MKTKFKSALVAALGLCSLWGCSNAQTSQAVILPTPMPKPASGEYVVPLVSCQTTRIPVIKFTDMQSFMQRPKEEKLVRGDTTIGGDKTAFFLPASGPYPVSSEKNHQFDNTSTMISVDSDGNGTLDNSERWWASKPIRLGDKMFEVKQIDPGGTWILLANSKAPLGGAIVGKPCPQFKFQTTDGQDVTLASYKGKSVLLDVWSQT